MVSPDYMSVVDYGGGRLARRRGAVMIEGRWARLGRVVVAGGKSAVLCDAVAREGFVVDGSSVAVGVVGLCCFDVALDVGPATVELFRSLRERCDVVALVGVGIEDCPQWPARCAAVSGALDPVGAAPLFAVALTLAQDGDAQGSGLGALIAWVGDEAAGIAGVEMTRRSAAERLTGLRVGSAAVRTWAGSRIHAGFRELVTVGQGAATRLRSGDVDRFGAWVRYSTAALEDRLVHLVAEQVAHLQATALVGLGPYSCAADPRPIVPAPTRSTVDWPGRSWGAEDAVLVLIGASSGLAAGRFVSGSLADWVPGWAAALVVALIGVGVAAVAVTLRRRVILRNQARAAMAEVVADARARTEWRVAAMLNGVEPAVAARVRRSASSPNR